MSHEPECPQYNAPHNTFCVCNVLSSAYQRGREDAVKAITQHLHYTELMILEACCHEAGRGKFVRIARGDSEQE